MIRIQVLFYFIFLWALKFENSYLRLWRKGILFSYLKFLFLRKALSFPFGHDCSIIGQDMFFFLIHEKAKWLKLLSLVIPQNLNGSLQTSVVTLTLYKGKEYNFWGLFKAFILIHRYSEQKLISPKLRKNNLYPYVHLPVCCLQAWLKTGQNQLKSWSWFQWTMWLYDHCQPRDEQNMLINFHAMDTKMPFFICHSFQVSEEYTLLICSGIIELWSWSTTGIALCKGAVAHCFLLAGYCLLPTIRGFTRENKVGVSETWQCAESFCVFSSTAELKNYSK